MWKAMRAEYKALKRQEEEERRQRELQNSGLDAETAGREGDNRGSGSGRKGFLRRVLGGGKKKTADKGQSDPKSRKVVDGREAEDEEEWLSDAETEIDMVQALERKTKTGTTTTEKEAREGKTKRKVERAPPYVFLQALPGVTVGKRM